MNDTEDAWEARSTGELALAMLCWPVAGVIEAVMLASDDVGRRLSLARSAVTSRTMGKWNGGEAFPMRPHGSIEQG